MIAFQKTLCTRAEVGDSHSRGRAYKEPFNHAATLSAYFAAVGRRRSLFLWASTRS